MVDEMMTRIDRQMQTYLQDQQDEEVKVGDAAELLHERLGQEVEPAGVGEEGRPSGRVSRQGSRGAGGGWRPQAVARCGGLLERPCAGDGERRPPALTL